MADCTGHILHASAGYDAFTIIDAGGCGGGGGGQGAYNIDAANVNNVVDSSVLC